MLLLRTHKQKRCDCSAATQTGMALDASLPMKASIYTGTLAVVTVSPNRVLHDEHTSTTAAIRPSAGGIAI